MVEGHGGVRMNAKSNKKRKVTDRGLQLVNRAMKDPVQAKEIVAIRAKMDLEDKVYAESLSGMRKAAQLTQEVVAQKLGITQAGVSRLESQGDMYLSTFANYLEAVGSDPRIMITVSGQEIELDLRSFSRIS